jgi:uncharacterized protein (TIGR03437 family)
MKNNAREMMARRTALRALAGAGAGALFIPAWNETVEAADAITCVPSTPTVTEGPYWVDEKLFRSDIRTDPATGQARAGVPLTLVINVQNLTTGSCTPLAGAYVDVWHCDAKGIYSDEPTYNPGGGTGTVNTSGQKFLRGYQITDESGQVIFATIYPGWYSGRTIHIHFRIRTYSGNTVLGNFVSQIFFDETINNTVMAQPAYSRSTARDTTNARDMVYRVANPERLLATTTGDPGSGYTANITIGVTLATAAAAAPVIAGVANAMSGASGVAPGTWISIYGSNFTTATRAVATSDLVNSTLPTALGGVSARINGKAAYVHYVSANQVNVLAPADTSTGQVTVTVTNAAGTSNTLTSTMQSISPGVAVAANYVRAVRYPDGAIINGTGAAETGYTTAAAVGQGDIVALYGTGFGPTNSSLDTGAVFTGAYPTTNPVTVTIGGASAEVLWAGLVGAGLYQLNVRVPATLPDGDHDVVASVSGLSSQSTSARLKVMASAKLPTQSLTALLRRSRLRGFHPAGLGTVAGLLQISSVARLAPPPPHSTGGCIVQIA